MDNNTAASTSKALTRRRVLGLTLMGTAGLAVLGTALKGLPGFLKRDPAPSDGPAKGLPQDSIFQPRETKKS
jgi:hypothetical protein